MSKSKNSTQEAEVIDDNKGINLKNPQGKTVEELKEVAETLQTQRDNYQTMAVKAQGALEVVLQMLPEEKEKSEG